MLFLEQRAFVFFIYLWEMKHTLKVHSIESFGTHDGPGVRLVIFLQGCNLKCLYCQNADTIPVKGGKAYPIDELVERALNMRGYFGKDGGVTVSGGEPLLQSAALVPFFEELKKQGIHTNIDTNGTIVNMHAKQLVTSLADLVMFDIKHATPDGFLGLTGKPLFEQSATLIDLREESNKAFWFRYVLVPGYTDPPEYLKLVGERYGAYKNLKRFQILPYHKLGVYKWEALGEKYHLENTLENTEEQIEQAKQILGEYFPLVV